MVIDKVKNSVKCVLWLIKIVLLKTEFLFILIVRCDLTVQFGSTGRIATRFDGRFTNENMVHKLLSIICVSKDVVGSVIHERFWT